MKDMKPKDQKQKDTPDAIYRRADSAIRTLESARKEACAEYNERIRKLRDAKLALDFALTSGPELFDINTTISPEIARLIQDPTHSL